MVTLAFVAALIVLIPFCATAQIGLTYLLFSIFHRR